MAIYWHCHQLPSNHRGRERERNIRIYMDITTSRTMWTYNFNDDDCASVFDEFTWHIQATHVFLLLLSYYLIFESLRCGVCCCCCLFFFHSLFILVNCDLSLAQNTHTRIWSEEWTAKNTTFLRALWQLVCHGLECVRATNMCANVRVPSFQSSRWREQKKHVHEYERCRVPTKTLYPYSNNIYHFFLFVSYVSL